MAKDLIKKEKERNEKKERLRNSSFRILTNIISLPSSDLFIWNVFFYDESQPTRKSVLMVFPWHTIDSSDHENSDVATKRTVSSRDLRQEKTYASVEYTKDTNFYA